MPENSDTTRIHTTGVPLEEKGLVTDVVVPLAQAAIPAAATIYAASKIGKANEPPKDE